MIFSAVQHKHLNFESGALFLFRLDRFPGCVKVETLYLFECVEGSWPEVLLIDHAVVDDDEGPHTRYDILGGCSEPEQNRRSSLPPRQSPVCREGLPLAVLNALALQACSRIAPGKTAAFLIARNHLRGRDEDVRRLVRIAESNPLVFLTGESGYGKSAVLETGRCARPHPRSALVLVFVDNWGADWVQGREPFEFCC
jgi:hypothetical protein